MTAPALSHARVPVGSADVLPRLAATRWSHRTALRAGDKSTTFAELDDAVSRLAFGLRQLIGGDGLPVVVSAALGTAFPAAFYAVLRSGNVAVPVNPRMPAETFAGVLVESGARAALLGRVTYERVRPVLAGASLEQVVLYDAAAEAGQLTCAALAGRGSLLVEPRDRDEHAAAIVDGRRVRSHHELKAAALAEGLTEDSVVLNATSAYQPADLGAGLAAGATQVLLGNPDPAAALREAARVGATHVRRDGADSATAVAS